MTPETLATTNRPWALEDLPPFPWITTKVLQLFSVQADDVEIKRLVELIRADTTLSSEMLRRANSALYGLRSQVSSLGHAVTMMGLSQVKSLAMTIGLATYLRAPLRLAVLRRCWRHSLACALLSGDLAEACRLRPDQAYTSGLLHDVGRLALLVKYPQSYADLLSVVIENGFSLLQSERDLFDIDHCEAGSWLAQEWDFPPELVEVIGRHHDPRSAKTFDLLQIVHLCCRLADALGFEVADPVQREEPKAIQAEFPPQAQRLLESMLPGLKAKITYKVNALE
jgi:putative nucleotidyltransferase with HDIG domain